MTRSSEATFRIREDPLDAASLTAAVAGPDRGAIATFTGVVRNHHAGRAVSGIEYHAYAEMAERVLAEIGKDVERRFPGTRIAIHHRVGSLAVGEASVIVAVAAPHRKEALAGCAHAIERLKSEAPIWKKERYEGSEAWIEGSDPATGGG